MSHPRSALLSTPWGSLGDLATASFFLAALSGVALAVPYDPANAYGSLATLLLANAPGSFFRNLHYWSGQLCLVLTVLHLWDHLRVGTEGLTLRGVWLRLSLTLPVLAFLMLSGFLLRGDAEGQQALRIVSQILGQVPWVGALAATLLFGRGARLDVVYVQHVATATILVWLFLVEHSRQLWPRPTAFLAVGLATGALSLGLTPGLHDGLDPIVKGPWYFLGLQELLHWSRWPVLVLIAAAVLVVLLYAIRGLRPTHARWAKRSLLVLGLVYGGLCGVGGLLRGEAWAWAPGWPRGGGNLQVGWVFARTPAAPVPLPLVQGRPEGCLVCHAGVTGLGNAHRPEAVGCASCHGGNPLTLQKTRAHAGLRSVPGNLADAPRSCGTSACHAEVIPRVDRSVMTSMAGVIAVDREVFGEPSAQGQAPPRIEALGHRPADTHLRQLCAACHLGVPKVRLGPDTGEGPGGGCNACHLTYDAAAQQALAAYQRQKAAGAEAQPPRVHPALSLKVDNRACFECHSRSGRISLAYEGWMELHDPLDDLRSTTDQIGGRYRTLADDRVLERIAPDIHHEKGLDCVDCHTALEVMGDGKAHGFKREQVRLACADCHGRPGQPLPSLPLKALDPESRRLLVLRAWPGGSPKRFIRTQRGDALVNGTFDERSGRPVLIRKRTGERLPLKPQSPACTAPAHRTLACGTCHTAWTPSCASCHTSYDRTAESYDWITRKDVAGAWVETSQGFEARPPTLGMQVDPDAPAKVQTFAPGMVMTLVNPGASPAFQRRYARTEPHTTGRKARACASCHNDPEALGYGKGRLRLEAAGGTCRWTFTPALPPGPDGLPADAWLPFLGTRPEPVSTRPDVRPFTPEEQRRILTVGACLTCHEEGSRVMRDSLRDFKGLLARRTPRCRLPVWD